MQRLEVGEVGRPQRFVFLLRDLDVSPSRSCQLEGILAPPQSGIILSDHVNVLLSFCFQQPVCRCIVYRREIGKV